MPVNFSYVLPSKDYVSPDLTDGQTDCEVDVTPE
jgi:hypothetical protein